MKKIVTVKTIVIITGIPVAILFTTLIGGGLTGNPFIFFIIIFPYCVISAALWYLYRQIRVLRDISEIYGPEKIRVLHDFIRRNTVDKNFPFNRSVRRRALTLLAAAYAENGDYAAAYRTCGELQRFLPGNFAKKTVFKTTDVEFLAVQVETLFHLGKVEAAEKKLRELLAKEIPAVPDFFKAKFIHAYFLVFTGDYVEASEKIKQAKSSATPDMKKNANISFALLFLETKILMAEERYAEARAGFEYIAASCRDYKYVRLSKEELYYWTTRF